VLAYRCAVTVGEQGVTARAAPRGGTRVAGARSLFPLGAVVLPWLLSRVISVAVLLVAMNDPSRGSRFRQLSLQWDGAFYLDIARHGYGPVTGVQYPKWPFFPGLPELIRLLGALGRDDVLIFVVNQLAFLVALAGLYRLARRHASGRAAALSVWALALFPASFVFSMTYPSAIFLAASVWAFILVEDHIDVAAGVVAAAAAIVRPNGIVVAIALVFAVKSWRRAIIVAGPAVVVIAAWCWYCYDRTGDALVFLTTKSRWEEISAIGLVDGHAKLSVLPHGVLALGAIVVVVLQRKRLPGAWILLVALSLLPSLITGMVGLARYTNECFPPFVAAGEILERWSRGVQYALLALSTCGMVAFAYVVGHYTLVP
jgi:hypothetical protein